MSPGSKDRPPAALSEDEGGVPNFLRAFEEGFSPPATNTYYAPRHGWDMEGGGKFLVVRWIGLGWGCSWFGIGLG